MYSTQTREAKERGEALADMVVLHVTFLLLARRETQVMVQTGISGVEPGIRNSLRAHVITEEDSGSLQCSPP